MAWLLPGSCPLILHFALQGEQAGAGDVLDELPYTASPLAQNRKPD